MTTLSQNGGTIFINGDSTNIQYSLVSSSGPWTTITAFPINIINTGGNINNILTIKFVSNITINNVNRYFVCKSSFITFDGQGNNVGFAGVTNYLGFIRNDGGTFNYVNGILSGFHTITIQNINTVPISGTNTLANDSAWICDNQFGRNIKRYNGFDASTNLIKVLNCTNSVSIPGGGSGGIVGAYAGSNSVINISGCTNSGAITGGGSGGIVGRYLADNVGDATIMNCSNSGNITTGYAGGIVGQHCGNPNGTVTISGCNNSGTIGSIAGGIVGVFYGGILAVSYCINTGNMTGNNCGGILASTPSANNQVTVTNCYNTGNMTGGEDSGGFSGAGFGYNTSKLCTIRNCYNLGNNSQRNGGGIVGSNCALTDNPAYTSNVLIENCYNLGAIAAQGGGIIGATTSGASSHPPTVRLINCYNTGNLSAPSASGLIANNFYYKASTIITNCYNASNNSWTDASANAALTGIPNSNNLGTIWTSAFPNKPWVLSSFNNVLYEPKTALVNGPTNSYATTDGLIQGTGIKYSIVSNEVSVSNSSSTSINGTTGSITYTNIDATSFTTYTTNVIMFKGSRTTGIIYGYQLNNFTLTYKPPPALITNLSELSTFMEFTGNTDAIILNNIEITSPLVAEIPKTLMADTPSVTLTIIG